MTAPIVITGRVVGAEGVVASFERVPGRVRRRLWESVKMLGLRLQANVVGDWLSGRVLHRRTGRLAGSVKARFVSTATAATSTVGTNLSYGRFWEYGFHGMETVRAHTRRFSQVFGRPVTPGTAHVGAHSRRVDQAPRAFLHPALRELEPTIRRELQAAVDAGLAEG